MGTLLEKVNRLFDRALRWVVPPANMPTDLPRRWDGVGHKHIWQPHGIVLRCHCGMRVPADD